MLDFDKTLDICRLFFDDCYKHWLRDFQKNPIMIEQIDKNKPIEDKSFELAVFDIKNLKHNPFSPNGEKLDTNAIEYFLNYLKKN